MELWNPSELSAGGARGIFWFFTELPRVGEKICRKTVDGLQTWSGRSGRGHKNGFPIEILVAKLVIKDTAYHMLELTLDKEKPIVSLCKIWRTGTAAAESPQTMNQGTSTSNQVEDILEEATEMQIEQPQGQFEGIKQQLRMPNHEMSMIDYTTRPNSTEHGSSFPECWNINHIIGQLEDKGLQPHVPGHALSTSDYVVHPYSTGEYVKYNVIGQHEGTEQQLHIPHHVLSTSNYPCHPNSTCEYFNDNLLTEQFEEYFNDNLLTEQFEGRFEGIEQEPHMPDQAIYMSDYIVPPNSMRGQLEGVEEQVKSHDDVLSMSSYVVLPESTKDFIPSTGQDDDSVYQAAVSYLYEQKESFGRYIVLHGGNEAHEIISKAKILATNVRNVLNRRFTFLGINTEPENTRPASNNTNNNQLRTTTNSVTEQATMQAPETTTTQDEFPEQEMRQQMEGCSIDEDYFYLDDDFYQSRKRAQK